MKRRKTRSSLAVVTVLGMLIALLPVTAASAAPGLLINEVDADQVSTDSAEFVELFDGGDGNTDLTGLSIVLYNGSDNASYDVFDLDGLSTDGDGYFVLCGDATNVANCDLDVFPDTNLIQNGADAVALVEGDAVDYPEDTPVSTTGVVDAIVYDTDDSDDADLLVLLNAGQPQVNERGGGDGTAHSNQRCPNGSGGARNTETYAQHAPTPGEANVCTIVEPPDPTAYKIHEIQGSGTASPLVGELVTIQGVVVGDFQGSATDDQFGGFHVQEEDGDTDENPMTSEGIFVFAPGAVDVEIGNLVTVVGTVSEFFGLTEIGSVESVDVDGTGVASPAEVSLPVATQSDWEKYEGMHVTFSQELFINEFFNFDRFGEVVLGASRQFQPTNIYEPGSPEAIALADANSLGRIRLDDGQSAENPVFTRHPAGGEFTLTHRFRGGDIIRDLTGVVDYAFGSYKIQPTQDAVYEAVNLRSDAPDVGGTVKVAAFNVLNFFTHYDDGTNDICGPLGINECRGADTDERFTSPDFVYESEEYPRQRDKIVAGIIGLDADVVGLMEIENDIHDDEAVYPNQAHDPVIQLVAALNAAEAAAGSGFTWDWDIANYYNNYPVRNEIIYRNTVTPYGPPVALQDVAFDGVRPYSRSPLDPVGRPPVAQTFIDSTGEMFTVVANHFKSKGSGCDDGVFDPVTGDLLWLDPGSDNGQGNCPLTRVRQSEAMMAWLATDPTGAGDPDVLIIGDLNSYTMEDPIDVIEAAGYTNLVKHFEGMYAYSYVFDGQLGNLDHALGSASIMSQVTGTAAWHINSDEPDILDYDTSFKKDKQDQLYEQNAFRASDHDPVIVGLDLGVRISATPDTLWAPNHKYVNVEVSANRGSGAELTVVITGVASSENDSGYSKGDMPDDVGNIDGNMVELRAERYTLEGRTYTVHVDLYDDGAYVTSGTVDVVVPHDQREVKPTTN